jgi:tetratricopeptide (TPR) repeat protein
MSAAPARRWYDVELAYLRRHAGDRTIAELAERLRTDPATVKAKLEELRLGAAAARAAKEKEGPDAVELYQQGISALYAGDWQRAETLFHEVAKDGPGELTARARQFAAAARARAVAGQPEPEDPWVRAVFEKNRGAYDEALALCLAEGRAEHDGRFAYLAAVLLGLRGEIEQGRTHLDRAIELDPHNRAHALHDPDLAPYREQPTPG